MQESTTNPITGKTVNQPRPCTVGAEVKLGMQHTDQTQTTGAYETC